VTTDLYNNSGAIFQRFFLRDFTTYLAASFDSPLHNIAENDVLPLYYVMLSL
jgi:hypothetical protein